MTHTVFSNSILKREMLPPTRSIDSRLKHTGRCKLQVGEPSPKTIDNVSEFSTHDVGIAANSATRLSRLACVSLVSHNGDSGSAELCRINTEHGRSCKGKTCRFLEKLESQLLEGQLTPRPDYVRSKARSALQHDVSVTTTITRVRVVFALCNF